MVPTPIDTSLRRSMYAQHQAAQLSPPVTRTRSHSTASTSSSISIVTPVPSSGNPSSSSLDLSYSSDHTPSTTTFVNSTEDLADEDDDENDGDFFVRAMHDFVPQQQNATCLAFSAGVTIRVLNRDPSGWWDGEISGRRGWFPSNYVTPIEPRNGGSAPPGKHRKSMSDASYTTVGSKASTTNTEHGFNKGKSPMTTPVISHASSHTPPLMIPLLNGLQLLQNTTLARRVSHYQPAVGCIIQCIRALLQHTDCLARGAPLLRRFPVIAQERKRVLAELALLVSQSKKASSPEILTDEERDPEEELMLRLAGQVFARVRRFLAVIVQCGIDLPDRSISSSVAETSTSESLAGDLPTSLTKESDNVRRQYGFNADDEAYYPLAEPARANGHVKQKSMAQSIDSASTSSRLTKRPHQRASSLVHPRFRSGHMSLGSTSSFSSFSSLESPNTPASATFPEGPCTAAQIQQALRVTHDTLLSTIAAFIGHVHQHSRAAHASSTGHLFALVRQIVDVVCRLLTVVDAVMGVEAIPLQKRATLEVSKENLYQMSCALADAVREMATGSGLPPPDEEDERRHLLKVATDALRAGSDCVTTVKVCLVRPSHVPPYLIVLPPLSDSASPPTESTAQMPSEKSTELAYARSETTLDAKAGEERRSPYGNGESVPPEALNALAEQVQQGYATTTSDYEDDDEDTTLRSDNQMTPGGRTPKAGYHLDPEVTSPFIPPRDRQSFISALSDGMSGETIDERDELDDDATSSPTTPAPSDSQTSEEDAKWQARQRTISLENKLLNGDLPAIPQANDEDEIPLAWALSHDYAPQDVAYNNDGQLVGATLEALVERMTPHDQIVDASFSSVFFLTFRLFCSPAEFAEAVISRFNLSQPSGLSESDAVTWSQQKLLPVRLRVQNLLKSWLEADWRTGADEEALPILQAFAMGPMAEVFPAPAQRLVDIIASRSSRDPEQPGSPVTQRQRINERFRDSVVISPSTEMPRPSMTKALLSSLRARNFSTIAVTDFDALELARQLTLIESELYNAVTAEEVLDMGRKGAMPATNVKAVTTLSTAITGWVSESILGEQDVKKRVILVKFYIKVADRCTTLNNFSTPRSILAALDSSTISRLHQTWSGLAQKSKLQLESLRRLADHARNYHEYRTRLRNTTPPAVPFLGLYLTDLTFCREGNPSHRPSPLAPNKKLLNFNKYHKLARIVQDLQRFQQPVGLKDVPEAQEYIRFCLEKAKDHGDLDDLYRRSQLLEPKRAAETPTSGELKPSIFSWASRSQASSSSTATLA